MTRQLNVKAMNRLRELVQSSHMLVYLTSDSPRFLKWRRDVEVAVRNIYGRGSNQVEEFGNIRFTPTMVSHGPSRPIQLQEAFQRGLGAARALLLSMIDEIDEYGVEGEEPILAPSMKSIGRVTTNEVFVVHGRDEGAKDTVARFLEAQGLQPVVLKEQPNEGRTVIEKFEHHAARVVFAVVLFTPDDAGSLQGSTSEVQPRARQNVIFELGYFIGRLGRDRACALIKGDVEVPSDYYGVLYIKMDDTLHWKAELVRELKRAGFDIDANRIYPTVEGV